MMEQNQKIQIGTVGESYTHRRNFSGHNQDRVEFKRAYDWLTPYRFLNRFSWFKNKFASEKLKNIHLEANLGNYDMYHFFHGVSNTKKPWFSSFSTALPRWGMTKDGVEMLRNDSCKQIIALSDCAYQIQSQRLKKSFPEAHDLIMEKAIVLHPPQKKNIASWSEKNISKNDTIKFVLIGNHFFRKGGMEILKAFKKVKEEKANISLTIISNIGYGDYASSTSPKDKEKALEFIESYKDLGIYHLQNIPNPEVLDIIRKSHVGLLPTYADTYGYSVLEFQSFACPVITTDIRALPEINNNKKGWIIEVEKDEENEAYFQTPEQRKQLSATIEKKLILIFREIAGTPELVEQKGILALDELYHKNSPEKNAKKLMELYSKAFK